MSDDRIREAIHALNGAAMALSSKDGPALAWAHMDSERAARIIYALFAERERAKKEAA